MNNLFKKRHFDRLISVTPYAWPMSHWINQFKYQRRHDYASLLGFVLQYQWHRANEELYDCSDIVISVPTHQRKWQLRGFNQAHLLAEAFSKYHQISYQDNLLRRVKYEQAQVGQSGTQRRKSVAGNFALSDRDQIAGKKVLLIDDVITTGATINEISRLLKSNYVKNVTVLTLCVSIDKC